MCLSLTAILPCNWGARATGLALIGGVITMADYEHGVIPHALAISVPVASNKAVWPATRTDGPGSATPSGDLRDAVDEGARLDSQRTTTAPEQPPNYPK